MSNFARDTTRQAREGVREANRVASEGSGDIGAELAGLRDDVARLASELADVVSARGRAAWGRAKSNAGDVASDVQDKGMEAVGAVRDAGDNMVDAIDDTVQKRPYTTLALALGIGFLIGATWRR